MKERLLHTPEGVRDVYSDECETKLMLQNNIHKVMKLHGFKDIQTPSFEYFDIFSQERGTTESKDMYKFFDREGHTLVLRPDFTPSIARCVSKYYKDEILPIRLCYMGNIFVNNTSYQGKLKELTQIGAELINDSTVDADAQIIAMTIECLLSAGLKEFQVEIGEADFFRSLVCEAGFTKEEEFQLRVLIESKNFFGVEELIVKKNISDSLKQVFLALPNLFGTQEKLTLAKSLTNNERALEAINRLEDIYKILTMYGLCKYVTFDLGMLNKYDYYTGIIFNVYTYGTGDVIAGGGRYDNLVEQFGKEASAIGLAILVDPLMIALSRHKVTKELEGANTLLLYEESFAYDAIMLATHFRRSGMNIELLKYDSKLSINDYISYGHRLCIGGILYYKTDDRIEVINCQTGEINTANIKDII